MPAAVSFGGHRIADVKRALLEGLLQRQTEAACYWAAELVCGGNYVELWDLLLTFYGQHLASPLLAPYIELRAIQFKVQMQAKSDDDCIVDIEPRLRRIFSELVCVMTLAARKVPLTEVSLPKTPECHLVESLRDRFKAPHTGFAGEVWNTEEDGSHQLFIAVNEFAFCLNERLIIEALFWVEWIARYPESIGARAFAPVLAKHKHDAIWIVWELLLKQTATLKRSEKIVNSMMFLYGFRYTGPTTFKRRRFLLYSACFFLATTPAGEAEPILSTDQKRVISEMMQHIDVIYDQVTHQDHVVS